MEFYDSADIAARSTATLGARTARPPPCNLAVHLTTLRNSRISPRCDVAFDMSRVRDSAVRSAERSGEEVENGGRKFPRIKRREAPRFS